MPILCVNVDHVATIRQARGGVEPDPVAAALLCESAGAKGITVHLREDRRHIQERDVRLLKQVIQTRLNLEMAMVESVIEIALDVKPHHAMLVPEKREELTTEGGLNVAGDVERVKDVVARFHEAGIQSSLFIDPDLKQVEAAAKAGTEMIELHTGPYSHAFASHDIKKIEAQRLALIQSAHQAQMLGLVVNAGHGLNRLNVGLVAAIPGLYELNVGHSIVSRAVLVGMERAVVEMSDAIRHAMD